MSSGNDENGGSLQSRYEFNSVWADRIARLILVGLIVDIGAAFAFRKSLLESSVSIIADALIAIGVWGELWFEKRAKTAADGIVAQANARAAEANARAEEAKLELARLTTPRTLTAEQQSELTEKVRPFAGTPFVLFIQPDPEPLNLANQIAQALVAAGWEWRPAQALPTLNRPGKPGVGMTTASGVFVQMHSSKRSEWEAAVLAAANAIHSFGIAARAEELTDDSINAATVYLRVGAKP
jgi:hypothetical protein